MSEQRPAPTSEAPFSVNGEAHGQGGARLCVCGAESPATANSCAKCGRFVSCNAAARTHGLYSFKATGTLPPDLRVSVEAFRDQVVADQGGLDNLTAIRAGYVQLLYDCEVGRRLLMNELVKQGIETKAGKAAYDRLLNTIDRWQRVAGALGMERRAKLVNPLDAVREAVVAANQEPGR